MAEQQPVSLTWAQYLASPVSVALVSLALEPQCPETALIGRNTEGEQLTPKTNAP